MSHPGDLVPGAGDRDPPVQAPFADLRELGADGADGLDGTQRPPGGEVRRRGHDEGGEGDSGPQVGRQVVDGGLGGVGLGRTTALTLAAGLAAMLLAGCGSDSHRGDHTNGKDTVASLQTPEVNTNSAAPTAGSGKKYKAGSKEAAQAFDEWHAKFKSCTAKKAQQVGIEVEEGTGRNQGDLVPKNVREMGTGQGSDGRPTYTDEFARKWFEDIMGPCRKELPAPETDDDKSDAARLAELRTMYACLNKAGLDGLHEPTLDAPVLFTVDGTRKYIGRDVDPKSKHILSTCGVTHG
ncbi:hypothetical protein [Streptomyces sp. WZ-12]|uniref:hypothetical protein n=1 Tax=Streptomyces sp. WZ-12 TaxID=3030210 RepID=UPI002380CF66|nr:hypothetical protein [Streptomyces sp. WZ-12]